MFVIYKEGNDFVIHPMHRPQMIIDRADNQADIVASFNMMMMTMALDHSQEYKKAEIAKFDNGVVVVVNRLGDTVFNILSPIFDTVEEASEFLRTTVCKCGYDIAEFSYDWNEKVCSECIRKKETSR